MLFQYLYIQTYIYFINANVTQARIVELFRICITLFINYVKLI